MITLCTLAEAGFLAGLIHLVVVLIILALVYFLCQWILAQLGAPGIILKLVMILCALVALYYIVIFLMNLTP